MARNVLGNNGYKFSTGAEKILTIFGINRAFKDLIMKNEQRTIWNSPGTEM